MIFEGKNGKYKIIKTKDGSLSLYSEFFSEGFHSKAGAKAETLYNFIEGCQLLSKAQKCYEEKRTLNIFEVGFGAGYGAVLTFQALASWSQQNKKKLNVYFVSTELDPKLISYAQQFWGEQWLERKKSSKLNFQFKILLGDARDTLPNFKHKNPNFIAEIIYQDPFSPRQNSELWTVEWFKQLKEIASSEVLLSTYSASQKVRWALLESGWKIQEREGFAHKKSSTCAFL